MLILDTLILLHIFLSHLLTPLQHQLLPQSRNSLLLLEYLRFPSLHRDYEPFEFLPLSNPQVSVSQHIPESCQGRQKRTHHSLKSIHAVAGAALNILLCGVSLVFFVTL